MLKWYLQVCTEASGMFFFLNFLSFNKPAVTNKGQHTFLPLDGSIGLKTNKWYYSFMVWWRRIISVELHFLFCLMGHSLLNSCYKSNTNCGIHLNHIRMIYSLYYSISCGFWLFPSRQISVCATSLRINFVIVPISGEMLEWMEPLWI